MASLRLTVDCSEEVQVENHHWSEHLLDSVSVRSRMKGRIRFHLGFEGDEILSDSLRRELHKLTSVRLETYSIRTRTALVTYGFSQIKEAEIVAALFKGIKEFARIHGECDLTHHHHENSKLAKSGRKENHDHSSHDESHETEEDCDHDHSATSTDDGIRKELFKLALTGGVLGYFVYRKLKGKPNPFAGNPLLDVASLVTIVSGYPIFRAGFDSVQKHKKATDDTLIGIAVVATLFMGESLTGLSVVWLINLGRLLEAITLKRSRTAVKDLMDIAPTEAWLVAEGQATGQLASVKRVAVESLEKKQIIRVFESEKVPLDGKIILGQALVQEAFITGEAIPKEKIIGETVYAGSMIAQGDIDIEVTNLVHDTVVARMIDAIENVRDKKAPIEKIGTKFAGKFVPISLGIAGLTLLVTGDLRRAITMLVIACPCAAGLATPTAVSASIGQAARKGILIKGGTHLEAAARIDTLIFDKTGTLTRGEPVLQRFLPVRDQEEINYEECLTLAASAEQYTTHPLGLVLVAEAKKLGLAVRSVKTHKVHAGMGITARIGEQSVQVGNRKFMSFLEVEVPVEFEEEAKQGFIAGESILYLSVGTNLQGAFVVQDEVRVEAHEMLSRLRTLGIKRVILASGDQKTAAEHVAQQLGITEVYSEMLPEDKLKLVSTLKGRGYRVAMVGDGVNDAQALSEADLSIAMGGGHCDVAIEAADVTLARNDLLLVPEVLDISQKTLQTIYQNFVASVGINAGGLAFSALGKLSPFSAAIVHNASTIAVVLNSLRLGKQVAGSNPLSTLKEVTI